MHIFGGFRTGPVETDPASQIRFRGLPRTWSWTAFLLGVFEIVLGIMLVIEPLGRGPVIYFAASVWALVGGAILIGDAVRLRRIRQRRERLRRLRKRSQQEKQEAEVAVDNDG